MQIFSPAFAKDSSKYILIDGVVFCRDDKTGYYRNSVIKERAHRFAFKNFYGSIPPDHHIHHIDGDKSNNKIDNLEALPASQHMSLHGNLAAQSPNKLAALRQNMLEKVIPAAREWHGSDEGLAWHREHAKTSINKIESKTFSCLNCHVIFLSKPMGQNKFCSNSCKSSHRRKAGTDNEKRSCAFCLEEFDVNRYSDTKTCGRSCSNKLRARQGGYKKRAR